MTKKILIVEDEESLLKLATILISAQGHDVIAVSSGPEALAVLAEQDVDLVLLDVMLPDLDGFEVCRQIKASPKTKSLPVVMLTAKKNQSDLDMGDEVGADWYITKPFKSANVIETVERFLNATN